VNPPPLARTNPDGSRFYVNPLSGESVPSVTTILKYMSKPALDGWAARLTAKYASENWDDLSAMNPVDRLELLGTVHERERQVKADKGTLVHQLCEAFAKGAQPVIEKSVDSYLTQFFRFLGEMNPEYVETEATCWNRQYDYAGTLDAVAVINGEVTILDIKSGIKCYPEHGLQLAALSHCEFIVDPDGKEWEMPRITRHALLHLRPRSWKLIPVNEIEACFGAFCAARKVAYWQENVSGKVLG
jgi:hypothetical protein